jgi:hypothetical protein
MRKALVGFIGVTTAIFAAPPAVAQPTIKDPFKPRMKN